MSLRGRRSVLALIGTLTAATVFAAPASAATLTPTSNPAVALSGSSNAYLIDYPSTSIDGQPITLTGSLLLPKGPAPAGGWPLAVWNHMTTGGADACAPSQARRTSSAYVDMTSGDSIVEGLLREGFAVVRPDYEGMGSPGPHPYLIGASLGRSVIDAAHGAVAADPRIGHDVVVAGHSEGAVAALFAASAPSAKWGDLTLRGVAAVTPPTRMADIVNVGAQLPVAAGDTTGQLVGLAALMISGAEIVDPELARLVATDGLNARAKALMPLIETQCFRDLAGPRAFGALAPADLLGPRGEQAKARLVRVVDQNDVAHLHLPKSLPIRIDAGMVDVVAPLPFTTELADTYRGRGNKVVFASHPAGHSQVPRDPATATAVAAWLGSTVR